MTIRRFLIIKTIIWIEMILVVSTLVSGSIYLAALLRGQVFLALIAEPVANFFASLLFFAFLAIVFVNLFFRIYRRLTGTKTPLEVAVKERVHKIGTEVSSKMGVKSPVKFFVVRGLFWAGAKQGNRVFVGETLIQDSTDSELEGVIGHELAHILGKHLLVKSVSTGLTFVVGLVAFYYSEPLKLWQIVILVVICLSTLVMLPIYWSLEYNADAKAAQSLGREVILQTLERLKLRSFDGISFTHPPLSRRLRRIKRLFPNSPASTTNQVRLLT